MTTINSHDITIRPFSPADMSQMIDLEKNVYGSGAYTFYFFRQLYDLFPTLIWVADGGPRLVGHICGALAQDGQTGWMLNFAVQAHSRRLGIGRRLVERCVEELIKAGAKRIKTTAVPDNEAGIRLCETLGFKKIGIEDNYYGDGTDRLIMERVIEDKE